MADGSFAEVLNLPITNRVLFLPMLHLFPQEQTINSHSNTAQPNSQETTVWLKRIIKKRPNHLHLKEAPTEQMVIALPCLLYFLPSQVLLVAALNLECRPAEHLRHAEICRLRDAVTSFKPGAVCSKDEVQALPWHVQLKQKTGEWSTRGPWHQRKGWVACSGGGGGYRLSKTGCSQDFELTSKTEGFFLLLRGKSPEITAKQLPNTAELWPDPCLDHLLPSQGHREKFQL